MLCATHELDSRVAKGETVSEVDRVIAVTINNRRVDFVLPALAGHEAGIERLPGNGEVYIVERGANWVAKGDWSPVKEFIEQAFYDEELKNYGYKPDAQVEYILSFCAVWVRDYYKHNYMPRPVAVLTGAQDSFKTAFQNIVITGMLGGAEETLTQHIQRSPPSTVIYSEHHT